MKKVLVTGVNGFVGPYLAEELVKNNLSVLGCGIDQNLDPRAAPFVEQYFSCDLTSASDVQALPWSDIDGVIHLAGMSAVGPSFDAPRKYMDINTGSITELFEACIKHDVRPRFVVISSGAVYASSSEPISETSKLAINSPYVVSKLSAELVTQYYATARNFTAVSVRPFNHIGPNQMPGFIVPDLLDQAKKVLTGEAEAIQVGDLSTKRDYTDVRDVVRAYRMLLLADELQSDVYNICSGVSISGEEILQTILTALGDESLTVIKDEKLIRPSDNPVVLGSHDRISNELGWQPEISLAQTLTDTISAK